MIQDFLFDGQTLSGFGYMICSFDSSNSNSTEFVSNMSYTEIKSPLSNISHTVSASYENNLSRTIQICKKNCNDSNYNITNDELSELSRWLCRKDYKWFKWIDDEDDDEIFYQVHITLKKIEMHDNKVGFELDIISNRPYGMTNEIKANYNNADNSPIRLDVYSDEEGYIYPDLIIKIKENGNLKITNTYENRITQINNCEAGEIITIIGNDVKQIRSSSGHNLSFDFNYIFPRLCSTYSQSNNEITVNLNCDIEIKYRGVRKVGI